MKKIIKNKKILYTSISLFVILIGFIFVKNSHSALTLHAEVEFVIRFNGIDYYSMSSSEHYGGNYIPDLPAIILDGIHNEFQVITQPDQDYIDISYDSPANIYLPVGYTVDYFTDDSGNRYDVFSMIDETVFNRIKASNDMFEPFRLYTHFKKIEDEGLFAYWTDENGAFYRDHETVKNIATIDNPNVGLTANWLKVYDEYNIIDESSFDLLDEASSDISLYNLELEGRTFRGYASVNEKLPEIYKNVTNENLEYIYHPVFVSTFKEITYHYTLNNVTHNDKVYHMYNGEHWIPYTGIVPHFTDTGYEIDGWYNDQYYTTLTNPDDALEFDNFYARVNKIAVNVSYNANDGYFDTIGNETNKVTYQWTKDEIVCGGNESNYSDSAYKISGSSNINYRGEKESNYINNTTVVDTVTINGTSKVHVELDYSFTSNNTTDNYIQILDENDNPITSTLASTSKTHQSFDINSNTIKFKFKTASSSDDAYGYYAKVYGYGCNLEEQGSFHNRIIRGTEKVPVSNKPYHIFDNYYKENTFVNLFDTTHEIIGDQTVYAKWKTESQGSLYDVLKDEALGNGLAREYTGSHQDSMDSSLSTEKIYHWYATNDTEGRAILEKNNVIFANQCFQMIRTTDTGGVKMIYNGEVVNNKCLNNRGTHVGYNNSSIEGLASNYWYGDDYTYDSNTKRFKISGTTEQKTWSATNGSDLVGKYTCKSTNKDNECEVLYLVGSYFDSTTGELIAIDSTSSYMQFGKIPFNYWSDSPSYVGYMYGDEVIPHTIDGVVLQDLASKFEMLSSKTINSSFWYADTMDYGTIESNKYSLIDPYQLGDTPNYQDIVGKYTFASTDMSTTGTSIYYIAGVEGTKMYYIKLEQGQLLSSLQDIYFGDSITDNGDGTYTINNPVTVSLTNWFTDYLTYSGKYTCRSNSTTCNNPRFVSETTLEDFKCVNPFDKIMIGKNRNGLNLVDTVLVTKEELVKNASNYVDYKYTCNTTSSSCSNTSLRIIDSIVPTGYKYSPNRFYGTSATWDGTKYTLINPIGLENYNDLNLLSTHHYTCATNGLTTCDTLGYIYYYSGTDKMSYVELNNGVTDISDVLDDMFTKNTSDSTIKVGIEAWYKHNIYLYDGYVEDTIYCNDRSIRSINGWNPNGGTLNDYLRFKEDTLTANLSCTNDTDKFSTSNNRAQLNYKVGLMTAPEMNILNNDFVRKIGQQYWLISPFYYYKNSRSAGKVVNPDGTMYNLYANGVNYSYGLRPAISLIPNIDYIGGDGSTDTPYYIEAVGGN